MPEFRKKPVVIEAIQMVPDNFVKLCGMDGRVSADGRSRIEVQFTDDDGPTGITGISIKTLEGTMKASWGDWIITGVNGEFYPCKPDIFDATYEPATDAPDTSAEEKRVVQAAIAWASIPTRTGNDVSVTLERRDGATSLRDAVAALLKARKEEGK